MGKTCKSIFKKLVVLSTILLFPISFYLVTGIISLNGTDTEPVFGNTDPCGRIVSLAPSLTEVAFALGLGEALVAVSEYDSHPPEVEFLPKIIGGIDISNEQILSYKPSLILVLTEMQEKVSALNRLGITILPIEHRTIEGILGSFSTLGETCNKMAFAKELVETKRAFLNQVSNRHVGLGEKALLLISNIESIKDNQKISSSQLFIGGQDGFYSDILEYLGASNALSQQTVSLDSIGMEGIIAMNPTVIFEIFEKPLSDLDRKKRLQSWKEWSMIKAVADSRVYLVDKDYAGIPGPRFDLLLSDFERVLGSVTDD